MTSNKAEFCFSISDCQEVKSLNGLLLLALRTKTLTSSQLDSIINHGGNINTKDANDTNNSPLHVAASNGDPEIVRLLLERGAKASETNSAGQTPLDVAQGSEVVQLLQEHSQNVHRQESQPESDKPQSSITENMTILYKKRPGTSGISGQLYETKLLTLILFRAINRKDIIEFYLGSNVDGLGALDDVIFQFRDCHRKTRMKFIQAKHRDDPDKDGKLTLGEILKEKGDYCIHKYFDSYLSIRRKFGSRSNNDEIFKEEFHKLDCDFVIYTSAKENFVSKTCIDTTTTGFNTSTDDILFSTDRGKTFKFDYSPQHVKILAEDAAISRAKSVGSSLTEFILSGRTENILSDNLIKTYHVVLVQKLFKMNKTGYATFKTDFYESKEKLLIVLREAMYEKIVQNRKQNILDSDLDNFLKKLSNDPSAENVSKLLGNVLKYDSSSSTLKPIKNRVKLNASQDTALRNIKCTQETIQEAIGIIGRSKLEMEKVKLLPSFGNSDLPVRKSKEQQRIKHLVERFKDLFQSIADHDNIIRINDSIIGPGKKLNSGDVDLNGGFAGMVGNILVLDPMKNLLKFNCDENSLQPNAKMLLQMLKREMSKSEIRTTLEDYRFDIKIDYFPRLMFENKEEDEEFAKCFLDNLVFYTDQGKENEVEAILKNEIKTRYKISEDDCDAVFLNVHDKIQHWWKEQDKFYYLDMKCDYFDTAVVQVRDNPPLANISAICISKINRYQVQFSSETVQTLVSQISEGITNIVSSHVEQTCIKLLQHFGSDSHLFITSGYLKNMLPHIKEIFQLKTERCVCKTLIIVGDQETIIGIEELLNKFENSRVKLIVVTKERLVACVSHFKDVGSGFKDLTPDSQTKLLEGRDIFFQGFQTKLGQLMEFASLNIINAEILSLLICYDELMISGGMDLTQFDNIADFLIERKLLRKIVKIKKSVETTEQDEWVRSLDDFYSKCNDNENKSVHLVDSKMVWQKTHGCLKNVRENIESTHEQVVPEALQLYSDRIVIVAAEPGMGKSTLITEMSERFKKNDPLSWVVRIDLLNYSKEFSNWRDREEIDLLLAIKFLLHVHKISQINNECLFTQSTDGKIKFKNFARNKINGKELFEIELFLNFYNKGNIILLFDGFDEISPNYKEPVLKLMKILQSSRVNKLWITTRNDNNHFELEDTLGTFAYNLKPFSKQDQKKYLKQFWKVKLKLKHIDNHRFGIFSASLIKLFSNSINNTEASFMGVPLQMRMIATIFLNDFMKFLFKERAFTNRTERQISAKLDLVTLYDEFFRIKFEEVLFGDKRPDINKSDPEISELMENQRRSIIERHEKLALCALLDDQELKTMLLSEEIVKVLEDFKSGRERVGLICQVVSHKPRFVHQTFAEFFAARYLWIEFKSSKPDSGKFIREVFVPILTRSNRYQVCCFVQQIALNDLNLKSKNVEHLECKMCCFLVTLVPFVINYAYNVKNDPIEVVKKNHYYLNIDEPVWHQYVANRCARLLLKIVEKFVGNNTKCAVEVIQNLNQEQRMLLFEMSASEGYRNLLTSFIGILDSSMLRANLHRNGWYHDPLLTATVNGHMEVVDILRNKFNYDLNTWADHNGKRLINHLINCRPDIQFTCMQIFLEKDLLDGSPFVNEQSKIEVFPIIKLLFQIAPSHLVQLLACKTDFELLNKHKVNEQEVIHCLTLCLLAYKVQLIQDFYLNGADFSQSINSLMSQYCYRAVSGNELCFEFQLSHVYKERKIWNTLFDKIKEFLRCGFGYNRKDSTYDATSRQFVEQAYYIHLLLSKLCDENKSNAIFDTILKLIIICMKRHTLIGPSTHITITNNHIPLVSLEFERKYRSVFGSILLLTMSPYQPTKRRVTSDGIILKFHSTIEKYKETLKLKHHSSDFLYLEYDATDNEKYDVIHWIQNVRNLHAELNCTFEDALFQVTQEMKRSREKLCKMMEISEAKEVNEVKVFDTEHILNILDLQQVQTTQEMEHLMTKLIDCNGISLLALLLHINYLWKDCDLFNKLQEVITFTKQAPAIYNFWKNLDEQYQQLLQAIRTNCETVRNVLNQIDPDYRRAVINGQDPESGSPLHYASASGDLELVRTLLEFGADPNSRLEETGSLPRLRIETDEMENFKHFRPLHFAAMRGHGEIVGVLLENGAEIEFTTHCGRFAVELAIKYGHKNIVKQLRC